MLFAVDLTSKVGSSLGGSYRVKRVCMDSKVIKSFCTEYHLSAPAKVCICYDNSFFVVCCDCTTILDRMSTEYLLCSIVSCFFQGISGCVDLDFDVDSIGNDSVGEVQAMEFAKDVIFTAPMNSVKVEDESEVPPMNYVKDEDESEAPFIVKRNLSKSFDKVAGGKFKGRLKKIKVEKE
jgi:hypothetical protein